MFVISHDMFARFGRSGCGIKTRLRLLRLCRYSPEGNANGESSFQIAVHDTRTSFRVCDSRLVKQTSNQTNRRAAKSTKRAARDDIRGDDE